MGPSRNDMPLCPANRHCAEWARKHMDYCLCSAKDAVSLSLGLLSVISWVIAEIPQIITNYKQKSTEGLSLAFLTTWIIGDLFNLFGCMMEPATLPSQFYMAVLYTITTMILTGQTVHYRHIYPRLKYSQSWYKGPKLQTEPVENDRQCLINNPTKQADGTERLQNGSNNIDNRSAMSSPIPLPVVPENASSGKGVYYVSARSLSSSHTPTSGSFLAQRMSSRSIENNQGTVEEPLLAGDMSAQSASMPKTKNMLCVVSTVTFVGTLNLLQPAKGRVDYVSKKPIRLVLAVGRRLLQVTDGKLQENALAGNSGIGTFFGWAMAVIYMGGRLPQICLNIRRGNVEGLNPLMFLFALIGNITYMGSILVSSLDWSRIRPNLPWLVDASGCVLLDIFILAQFVYFHYWRQPQVKTDLGGGRAV